MVVYGIKISRGGTEVSKPFDKSMSTLGGAVVLRADEPRLDQLEGLADALKHSASTVQAGPFRVTFLQNQLTTRTAAGEYWTDLKGEPTVVFYSNKDMQFFDKETTRKVALHELQQKLQQT